MEKSDKRTRAIIDLSAPSDPNKVLAAAASRPLIREALATQGVELIRTRLRPSGVLKVSVRQASDGLIDLNRVAAAISGQLALAVDATIKFNRNTHEGSGGVGVQQCESLDGVGWPRRSFGGPHFKGILGVKEICVHGNFKGECSGGC